jgi:hypothetical protein
MRIIAIAILTFISTYILAQTGEYAHPQNPYYWKNRKPHAAYWQQDVKYNINATLIDSANVIAGDETLEYTNNSTDALSGVYFHLYQNAFIKNGYLENLNKANHFYQKFGPYEQAGKGTEIEKVTIVYTTMVGRQVVSVHEKPDSTNLECTIIDTLVQYVEDPLIEKFDLKPEIDFSIMHLKLPKPILPNQTVAFLITFKTYFDDGGEQRRRMKLFDAYGNKHFDGVHWYPRICVYDRKFGWETDQHLGKEFYGDFGTYEVSLNFPTHYVLDATGLLLNKEEVLPADLRAKLDIKNFANKPWGEKPSAIIENNGQYKTWKFRAINVHDFAWTADPTYRIGEENITLSNGHKVQCIALVQEPHASGWQDAALFASKVIQLYSEEFGYYAYPKMIVADARDGMEYPMLTLDGGSSPGYYGLFAHEIGHNWFFGMVGNNETYRASLDEGFTQFLTHWAMTRLTNENPKPKGNSYVAKYYQPLPLREQSVYLGYIRDAINKVDMPLNTHSDDFNGALHHGGGYGHVYYKTATMLYNLQYVLGDSLFLAAMQHYFNQWKFCHPYFEDFRNSIIQFTHVDLNWFFDQWLETTKTIDYSIKGKPKAILNTDSTKSDYYLVKFKRKGEMQMPLDVMAYSKNGKIYTTTISNTYFQKNNETTSQIWRGWGLLNPTYEAKIYCPGGLNKVSIDTTYRLADVNLLNNSSQVPIQFTFDHQIKNPLNRRKYILKWRPDLWYNNVDGIKLGAHFNGNYMQYKHVWRATMWYNTGLAKDYSGNTSHALNYHVHYLNQFPRSFGYSVQSMFLDGLWSHRIGVQKSIGKNVLSVSYKTLYRAEAGDLDYLMFANQWNSGKWNNTVNLNYYHQYSYKRGNGQIHIGLKSSSVGSDYDYAALFIQVKNDNRLGRYDFRTRTFAQWMTGSNVAPESRLNVAGANNEELMDNKFTRSAAFFPSNWAGYGNNINHFHAGGGLNIRGYAGYVLPQAVGNNQVQLFTGMSGMSWSGELEFDKLIRFQPRYISEYIHIDAYLFADIGFIHNEFKAGEFGLLSNKGVTSNLLMSAGNGFNILIKKWGKLDELKPLGIRIDMPWLINNTPFVDGNYFRYRWLIGVNRCF